MCLQIQLDAKMLQQRFVTSYLQIKLSQLEKTLCTIQQKCIRASKSCKYLVHKIHRRLLGLIKCHNYCYL
jgi:hypothetical protein